MSDNHDEHVCPKCGKDALEEYDMGRAWHCESCGASNAEYQLLEDAMKEIPAMSPEMRALLAKFEANYNAKLRAAGIPTTGSRRTFWKHLYAFARYDLRLSKEEFWRMTHADFEPFLDRYIREKVLLETVPTQAASDGIEPEIQGSRPPFEKPQDWEEKSSEYRMIGQLLLIEPFKTNKEICKWMDENSSLKCPYGTSWLGSYKDQKLSALINRIRSWVKVPGKKQEVIQ